MTPSTYNIFKEFVYSLKFFSYNYTKRTIVTFSLLFVITINEVALTALILPLIDIVTNSNSDNIVLNYIKNFFLLFDINLNLEFLCLLIFFLYLFKIFVDLFLGLYVDSSMNYIRRDIRAELINRLKNISWSYFLTKSHGVVVNLMTNEIDRTISLFKVIQRISISFLNIIVFLLFGLGVSIEIVGIVIFISLIAMFVARPMFKMTRSGGIKEIENLRDISSGLIQGLRSLKVFKAMGKESILLKSIFEANENFLKSNNLIVKSRKLLEASQNILILLVILFGYFIATRMFDKSLGELTFFGFILYRSSTQLTIFMKQFQGITSHYNALNRILEFVNQLIKYGEDNITNTKKFKVIPKSIIFKDVNFNYGKKRIIHKCCFKLDLKGLISIYGMSGAGKTTIIDLICKFYKPETGSIFLDNININEVETSSWRNMIGYVSQESFLLNKSIRENLLSLTSNKSLKGITNIIKISGVNEIIENKKEKANFIIGENGNKLSGGEKQRIAIARSLIFKPQFLILDEPTSSLDKKNMMLIIKTLKKISKRIPVIVVTHQSAFLKDSNTILNLKNKEITVTKNV